ncbi:MAG: hypothetical protein H5T43_06445 [Methanomethylovorans sp.]|nr:hypothetical protein [Methanomethylovorans sp.]
MVNLLGIFGNISLQFFIFLLLVLSTYAAHSKRTKYHCSVIGIAFFLQLFTILLIMYPSFSSITGMSISNRLLTELWIHHIAGFLVMLLIIYINLSVKGYVHFLGDPYRLMKPTLLLWIIVMLGGVFIYISLYAVG